MFITEFRLLHFFSILLMSASAFAMFYDDSLRYYLVTGCFYDGHVLSNLGEQENLKGNFLEAVYSFLSAANFFKHYCNYLEDVKMSYVRSNYISAVNSFEKINIKLTHVSCELVLKLEKVYDFLGEPEKAAKLCKDFGDFEKAISRYESLANVYETDGNLVKVKESLIKAKCSACELFMKTQKDVDEKKIAKFARAICDIEKRQKELIAALAYSLNFEDNFPADLLEVISDYAG